MKNKLQFSKSSKRPSWAEIAREVQGIISAEDEANGTKTNFVVDHDIEKEGEFSQLPIELYRQHVEQAKQKFSELSFGTTPPKARNRGADMNKVRLNLSKGIKFPAKSITGAQIGNNEKIFATQVGPKKKPLFSKAEPKRKPWRP